MIYASASTSPVTLDTAALPLRQSLYKLLRKKHLSTGVSSKYVAIVQINNFFNCVYFLFQCLHKCNIKDDKTYFVLLPAFAFLFRQKTHY